MAAAIGRRALSDSVGLTWGSGHLGQLGHEHQGDHSTKARDGKYMERLPRTVDGLLGRGVKQVRSRARFRAGFTLTAGSIRRARALSCSYIIPLRNARLSTAQIACGADHTVAVTNDGEVYVWGSNEWGQLGIGTDEKIVNVPRIVAGLDDHCIAQVDASHFHTVAMTSEGKVFTWGWGGGTSTKEKFTDAFFGSGGIGALGHGDLEDRNVPTLVEALSDDGVRAAQVGCGKSHTVVLTDEGMVWTWGKGDSGRLGHCSVADQKYPEPVEILNEDLGPCAEIACGESFSMALTRDGRVYTWGKNECGQLGLDATMDMHSFENYPQPIEAFEVRCACTAAPSPVAARSSTANARSLAPLPRQSPLAHALLPAPSPSRASRWKELKSPRSAPGRSTPRRSMWRGGCTRGGTRSTRSRSPWSRLTTSG